MGRIKTKLVKRLAEDLVKYHRDNMSKDFRENVLKISQYFTMEASKKIRNMVAGYVTRLMQKAE